MGLKGLLKIKFIDIFFLPNVYGFKMTSTIHVFLHVKIDL